MKGKKQTKLDSGFLTKVNSTIEILFMCAKNAERREAFGTVSMGYGGQLYLGAFRKYSDSFAKCTRVSAPQLWKEHRLMVKRLLSQRLFFIAQICTSQSAQLYLDVFRKYSDSFLKGTRPKCTAAFEGNNDLVKNVWARRSSVLTQTPVVDGFHAKQTTGPNVFRKYAALCAKNTRPRSNRGPGTYSHSIGLYDAISRGEQDGYEVRGRIILLMSFTGGTRY
ncbi:hypothetical protein Tco_1208446, partial [Tanacetum coccineum]